jgi:hypothetical protein
LPEDAKDAKSRAIVDADHADMAHDGAASLPAPVLGPDAAKLMTVSSVESASLTQSFGRKKPPAGGFFLSVVGWLFCADAMKKAQSVNWADF